MEKHLYTVSLDEELIAELVHEKFKAPCASTDSWNGEWANDRT